MNVKLDPWGAVNIDDYSKLFDEFGILPFDAVISDIAKPHKYMRRNVIFGHRSYDLITDAMKNGKPFSVMSGFMPSGKVHLGGKMVMEEIIWHQQMGGDAFVGIADRESHSVRGMSWEKCRELGINEYILSLIALGFETDVMNWEISRLSTGEKQRLALLRLLGNEPRGLLLDEPTNHLDLDAIIWLEDWLKRYAGTLLIISHDRDFLDEVVNVVVHIDERKLNRYSGNYSRFERQRPATMILAAGALGQQQRQPGKEQVAFVPDRIKLFGKRFVDGFDINGGHAVSPAVERAKAWWIAVGLASAQRAAIWPSGRTR